jgi:hypothetical protein
MLEQCNHFVEIPNVIRNARFLRWRDAERLMDSSEVVIPVMNRDRVAVVFKLFRSRQSRTPGLWRNGATRHRLPQAAPQGDRRQAHQFQQFVTPDGRKFTELLPEQSFSNREYCWTNGRLAVLRLPTSAALIDRGCGPFPLHQRKSYYVSFYFDE